MERLWPVFLLPLCLAAPSALAQERKERPQGKEIAAKVKDVKLNKDQTVTAKFEGRRITFAPANLGHLKSERELENGQIIGHLDTEAKGDESNLPPGKYNLFLCKVKGEWQCFAESGGKVVGQAKRVEVQNLGKLEKDAKPEKPEFHAQGWCWKKCWRVFGVKICAKICF